MQEDEEIGKVAAGAPIVICRFCPFITCVVRRQAHPIARFITARALELFLKDIVLESAVIAREQGAKKVMPYHMYVSSVFFLFLPSQCHAVADSLSGHPISHTVNDYRRQIEHMIFWMTCWQSTPTQRLALSQIPTGWEQSR